MAEVPDKDIRGRQKIKDVVIPKVLGGDRTKNIVIPEVLGDDRK